MPPLSEPFDPNRGTPTAHWIALAIVLLTAGAVRLWEWKADVEHFDEGVYASNLWFDAKDGYAYPDRHLYAPPLVPWLVEWSIIFFGSAPAGAMALGLATGVASVAAAWWLARRWFGPSSGLMTAIAVALLDLPVAYSRTCLTDVPLGLWWLLTLGLLHAAMIRGSLRLGAAAGAATALAWWTKYNGWMPLALSLAGTAAWLMQSKAPRPLVRQCVLIGTVAVVTALLLWSPVWWGLQDHGGYTAVARNHARYFAGVTGWLDGVIRQAGNLKVHETGFGRTVAGVIGFVPLVWLVSATCRSAISTSLGRRNDEREERRESIPIHEPRGESHVGTHSAIAGRCGLALAALFVVLAAWGTAAVGPGPLLFVLAAVGVGLALKLHLRSTIDPLPTGEARTRAPRRGSPAQTPAGFGFDLQPHRASLGAWMLAVCFIGMTALTPLYRPYPRLLLPWLMSVALALEALQHYASRAIATLSRSDDRLPWELRPGSPRRLMAIAVAIVMLGAGWREFHLARFDRTDLARAGSDILARTRAAAREQRGGARDEAAVYVYAEPAVFYHLAAAGVLAGPVGNLKFAAPTADRLPVPTFLVVGPHARRSPEFAAEWQTARHAFEHVGSWTYRPSLIVLLDHYSPNEVAAASEPITETLELYRLK